MPACRAAAPVDAITPACANPATPVRGCTHFKLRRLVRRVTQHYDHELAKSGLRTTQYSLLTHVARLGPIRPVDLAQAMTMDASTLTRNLKPLVAAGWLQLDAGADARSRLVTIAAAGRAKRAEAERHWKAAQQHLNQRLGIERIAALHALVDEALQRLSPAAEPIAQPIGAAHA